MRHLSTLLAVAAIANAVVGASQSKPMTFLAKKRVSVGQTGDFTSLSELDQWLNKAKRAPDSPVLIVTLSTTVPGWYNWIKNSDLKAMNVMIEVISRKHWCDLSTVQCTSV